MCFDAVVVQSLSHAHLFVTPWTEAHQAPLSSTVSQSLLKCMSIESMVLSNLLIPCNPLQFGLQSFLAAESFPVSWLFISGGQSLGVSASALVLQMNISGLISFRTDLVLLISTLWTMFFNFARPCFLLSIPIILMLRYHL